LSKLESAREAKLWDEIFTWTEDYLKLPFGSIKGSFFSKGVCANIHFSDFSSIFPLKI